MRTPVSTYRLQIRSTFTLQDAQRQVQYLSNLGADWVYLSPLLTAEEGSDHGYDVVDLSAVDPARGGEAGLEAVATAAHAAGMGVLVDIVPNHMGVATPAQNPWWWSLLKEGQGSRYAEAFDVDWAAGKGRILLPVLGSADDVASLKVVGDELHYYDHRFPLAEGSADDGADAATVHGRQHYELVDWRRADTDLNYRRFFAVNTLAGLRVEVPWVFDESHEQILSWVRRGWVDGLRVDHPDGLADPAGYLERLKAGSGGAYVLVEKILEPGEVMPPEFATEGTTGYDALAQIDRIFVDPAGEEPLTALDTELRGGPCDYAEMIHGTKREVTDGILNSEIRRLSRLIPEGTGLEPEAAVDALAEIISNFDVYRTYLPFGVEHLEAAAEASRRRRPELAATVDVLLPLLSGQAGDAPEATATGTGSDQLATRFQQTSGMVMAKGVEDCAFYRYTRLTSLTEVGADPSMWSRTPEQFHTFMAERQQREPLAMNALSTHDTKRGEDVRARISLISEYPKEWAALISRLQELAPLPDGPLANLLWQSTVGAWPIDRKRLQGYAEKAAREAGNSTTWTDQNEAFEKALTALVDAVFDVPEIGTLISDFVETLRRHWTSNALSAKLIQLTAPGVPDIYQGSELWEQSLTDPDNRRPIDFALRSRILRDLDDGATPSASDDEAKLLVTSRALRLRRNRPDLFTSYAGLVADGPAAAHVLAFDRGGAITVTTRLPRSVEGTGWSGTTLELPYPVTDVLTGSSYPAGRTAVAELLQQYPVALLATDTNADNHGNEGDQR
jgi:(1->4)-alpha-D-glucan 1-alpha-D-glucosylmutase